MKTLKLPLFYFAVLITVLFFTRCSLDEDLEQITDSLDSLQILVGTPEFKTMVHFEFVDAKTNEPISDEDVSVTISGRDAGYVYNNIGSKQTSYSSYWGMLDLVIDPHQVDSIRMQTDPIQFEATASLAGYISETQNVFIYDNNTQTVTIPLININNPPEGVHFIEVEVDASTDENGGLTEDLVVDFNVPDQGSMQKMKSQSLVTENIVPVLTIPKGVKFWGQAINGSTGLIKGYTSLKVIVEKVDFPVDGKFSNTLFNNFRPAYTGWFMEYGSTRFTITATLPPYGMQWTVQRVENGNLGITLFLPPNFISPETKSLVKENDIISRVIFAYGETSIIKEKQEVVKTINGKFAITSEFNPGQYGMHWGQSWGYLIPWCGYTGPKFTITSDQDINDYVNFSVRVFYDKRRNPQGYEQLFYNPNVLQQVGFIRLPSKSVDVVFTAKGPFKFTPDTVTLNNPCENRTYTVNIKKEPSNSEWLTINLDLDIISKSNNKLVVKPSTTIYYGFDDNSTNTALKLNNGKASFLVMVGAGYILRTSLGNTRAQGALKVEAEGTDTYKVTFAFNEEGTPLTIIVPKTDSKEINLKYQAIVSDDVFNKFQ